MKIGNNISKISKVLGVTRSSYYRWKSRPVGKRKSEDTIIGEKVKAIFIYHKQRYGSKRIMAELQDIGIKCGKTRVARLMREYELIAKARRKFKSTTDSNHKLPVAPNLLKRRFAPQSPNKVWTSDLTYIKTASGWLFLCVIIDLFSRKVVGWAMDTNMETEVFTRALRMAHNDRKPAPGILFHSDRGSQYASDAFRKLLKDFKMTQSMSRKGNCWDNAPTESFFHTLKIEAIYGTKLVSKEEMKSRIFEYIEVYYNRKRKHSFINLVTPAIFEKNYANKIYETVA